MAKRLSIEFLATPAPLHNMLHEAKPAVFQQTFSRKLHSGLAHPAKALEKSCIGMVCEPVSRATALSLGLLYISRFPLYFWSDAELVAVPNCLLACPSIQITTVSGAQVSPDYEYPPKKYSKTAFNTACGNSCGSAEASASVLARSSACAFNKATMGCSAVNSQVTGQDWWCLGRTRMIAASAPSGTLNVGAFFKEEK